MVDVSICMVSLNCWNVLPACLDSLRAGAPAVSYEIIMVDNASTDGTVDLVKQHYPEVRVVQNARNVGFTKATNQAIELSSGRYLLWLNTDTVVQPDTLYNLVQFLEAHPTAGIVGPKVLNADGSFQPQCKRGLPTPAASLYYMLKLHEIWPHNPRFGQYLLTHLSPDAAHEVDAVSGCCLLARRAVWDTIGPLDEAIFGFGEDIDWCVRAHNAGFAVWYAPTSVITHLKGQGGVHAKPYHKAWGIHQAMWVFYRKHLMSRYAPPITGLVWIGVWASLIASSAGIWVRKHLPRRLQHA